MTSVDSTTTTTTAAAPAPGAGKTGMPGAGKIAKRHMRSKNTPLGAWRNYVDADSGKPVDSVDVGLNDDRNLTTSAIRRTLRRAGVLRVSSKCIDTFRMHLYGKAHDTLRRAIAIMRGARPPRKTIMIADLHEAIRSARPVTDVYDSLDRSESRGKRSGAGSKKAATPAAAATEHKAANGVAPMVDEGEDDEDEGDDEDYDDEDAKDDEAAAAAESPNPATPKGKGGAGKAPKRAKSNAPPAAATPAAS